MFLAYKGVLFEKNFSVVAQTDVNYANLLRAEYSYCSAHIQDILKKTLSVYKIGCNKNHRLNYTCCDFKKLEANYMRYLATY